jgi:hypothetical protein
MLDCLATVRSRSALFVAPLVAACAIGGGDQRGENISYAQGAECMARVIVRLTGEPNEALLADLERTHAIELEPQGAIANGLHVYVLRAAGSADCSAAIDRLRCDGRVRSVDLDSRRELHQQ